MQIAFSIHLALRKDVLDMPTHNRHVTLKEFAHLRLCEPHAIIGLFLPFWKIG